MVVVVVVELVPDDVSGILVGSAGDVGGADIAAATANPTTPTPTTARHANQRRTFKR
jgi:hypothetical protein